jgi:glycerol-3-phosphate acyltransferase PlsY
MKNEAGRNEAGPRDHTPSEVGTSGPRPSARDLLPLPGLAAICLYLLLLAGVVILGVVAGGHYPPLFLVFAAGFISASAGLLMLFRWAWALALAAVFLLVIYNLWIFSTQHQGAALVQGLLNLVFFLYLVRPEVREKLR